MISRCALAWLAATIMVLATPAAASPTDAAVAAVRARAEAAGLDGTILLGDADGGSRTLTFGRTPVASNAVWRWASISKQVLAVLAMQEVVAGRLDPDAPVTRYWPGWRAPNAARIRIRDLLSHNSGLPQPDETAVDAQEIPAFYRAAAAAPAQSAAVFCAGPPKAAAQAPFEYNNCDSIVLAEVLRRTTGQAFETLVRERIARPLGLSSVGHYRLGDRRRRDHVAPIGEFSDLDALIEMGVYGGSGGLYGTIGDLWRFDRALLSGRLLPRDRLGQMWTGDPANGYLSFFQWTYEVPLRGCTRPVRIVERQGLIGGIELRNWLLPDSGRALILFSRKRPTGLGDAWMGRGLAYDLLSAAACT